MSANPVNLLAARRPVGAPYPRGTVTRNDTVTISPPLNSDSYVRRLVMTAQYQTR
jgi:hypothetical protein